MGKYYCKNMKYRINTDIPRGRVEYLVFIYYISREISIEHPSVGLALLAQLFTMWTKMSAKKERKQVSECLQNLYHR